jgi:hypothetical protein
MLGNTTLLDIPKVVDPAHAINTVKVVVWAEVMQEAVQLMQVLGVEWELGCTVH